MELSIEPHFDDLETTSEEIDIRQIANEAFQHLETAIHSDDHKVRIFSLQCLNQLNNLERNRSFILHYLRKQVPELEDIRPTKGEFSKKEREFLSELKRLTESLRTMHTSTGKKFAEEVLERITRASQ